MNKLVEYWKENYQLPKEVESFAKGNCLEEAIFLAKVVRENLKNNNFSYSLSNIAFIPNEAYILEEIPNRDFEAFNFLTDKNGDLFKIKFKEKEDFFKKVQNNTLLLEDEIVFFKSKLHLDAVDNKSIIQIYDKTIIRSLVITDFINNKNFDFSDDCKKVNTIFSKNRLTELHTYNKDNEILLLANEKIEKEKSKIIENISIGTPTKLDENIFKDIEDNLQKKLGERLSQNISKTVFNDISKEINLKYLKNVDDKISEKIQSKTEDFLVNQFNQSISTNNKLDTLEEKYNSFLSEIRRLENLIKAQNRQLENKENNSFVNISKNTISKIDTKKYETERPSDFSSKIVSYLYHQKNLSYNESTIKQFYAAMCTNQIIILSGRPGSGKTSLINGFSEATSIKTKLIPVQPNWHENQDLLGFYNPIDEVYVSTPLIDFIKEANENPDIMHLVCFDEMNLAQTEYYLSEFLSILELEDKTIELYSSETYLTNFRKTMDILKFIIEQYGDEVSKANVEFMKPDEIIKLNRKNFPKINFATFDRFNQEKNKLINYINYSSSIKVPNNIRFAGTINKDETTKDLSPKVVDRSIIMEVKKADIEDIKKQSGKDARRMPLKLSSKCFEVNTDKNLTPSLVKNINSMKEQFNEVLNIELNNRFDRHIKELYSTEIFDDNEFLDIVKLMKIVPKINKYIDSDDNDTISLIDDLFNTDMIESYNIYDEMKNYWEKNEVLTFWR